MWEQYGEKGVGQTKVGPNREPWCNTTTLVRQIWEGRVSIHHGIEGWKDADSDTGGQS